ncbi:nitroreductase family deazaflavin-dependent oxidoreductase [soil metagenome]
MRDVSHSVPKNVVLPLFRSRPTGALRFAFRLPIYLYRLGLGKVLGYRFLLLVHRGRKSGLPRETVLEVIKHDPDGGESVVLSGRGEKADWYRNIQVSPALEIQTGGGRYVPEQRFLAPDENHAAISEYASHHPLVFRFLLRAFGFGYPLNGTEEAQRQFAESLRLVAFRPGDETNVTRREVTG